MTAWDDAVAWDAPIPWDGVQVSFGAVVVDLAAFSTVMDVSQLTQDDPFAD